MNYDLSAYVEDTERMARIVNQEWIVDGVLQVTKRAKHHRQPQR